MWKNWLLQYRKPLQTLLEILAPVIFSIVLVVMRSLVDPESNAPKIFTPFCPIPFLCGTSARDGFSKLTMPALKNATIVYSPSGNEALRRSMSIFDKSFGRVIGYENAEKLEAHFLSHRAAETFAGIQLDDSLGSRKDLPKDLEVFLR